MRKRPMALCIALVGCFLAALVCGFRERTPDFKGKERSAKIYLLRHGFSEFNRFMESKFSKGKLHFLTGDLYDAKLMPAGQDEAVASNEYFWKELKDVPSANVQLAGSLLSRAYDTLLMSTALVWSSWDGALHPGTLVRNINSSLVGKVIRFDNKINKYLVNYNDTIVSWTAEDLSRLPDAVQSLDVKSHLNGQNAHEYSVHQIPALMEFGRGSDCNRRLDGFGYVKEDSPARLEDSSINNQEHGLGYAAMPPFKRFYGEGTVVKDQYRRRTKNKKSNAARKQIDDVMEYIREQVWNEAKTHIVLGTHSGVIETFARSMIEFSAVKECHDDCSGDCEVGVDSDGDDSELCFLAALPNSNQSDDESDIVNVNILEKKFPNGGVLSFNVKFETKESKPHLEDFVMASPFRSSAMPIIGVLTIADIRVADVLAFGSFEVSYMTIGFGAKFSMETDLLRCFDVQPDANDREPLVPILNLPSLKSGLRQRGALQGDCAPPSKLPTVDVVSMYQMLRIRIYRTRPRNKGKSHKKVAGVDISLADYFNRPPGSFQLMKFSGGRLKPKQRNGALAVELKFNFTGN